MVRQPSPNQPYPAPPQGGNLLALCLPPRPRPVLPCRAYLPAAVLFQVERSPGGFSPQPENRFPLAGRIQAPGLPEEGEKRRRGKEERGDLRVVCTRAPLIRGIGSGLWFPLPSLLASCVESLLLPPRPGWTSSFSKESGETRCRLGTRERGLVFAAGGTGRGAGKPSKEASRRTRGMHNFVGSRGFAWTRITRIGGGGLARV